MDYEIVAHKGMGNVLTEGGDDAGQAKTETRFTIEREGKSNIDYEQKGGRFYEDKIDRDL